MRESGSPSMEQLQRLLLEMQDVSEAYREFFDHAPIGFLDLDEDCVICRANPRAAVLLGRTQLELIAQPLHAFVSPSSRDRLRLHLQAAISGTRGGAVELEVDGPTGTTWLEMRSEASRGRCPARVRVSLADMTARKEDEATLRAAMRDAESAAAAKSQFLATMSHEIRTPLHGMLGIAEILSRTGLDDEQRDLVHTLRSSGDVLLRIINDVLDLSRLEAGGAEPADEPVDVSALVHDVVSSMCVLARDSDIELACRVDRSVPRLLKTDPHRIRQLLVNLVGNAIKFTTEGWVEVRADLVHRRDQAILRVAVEDTGIGIAADRIPALFDAFTQADSSIAKRFGGSGLGLAISARLARLLGGQLSVSSTEGAGSTFTLEIPVADVEPVLLAPEPWQDVRAMVLDGNDRSRLSLVALLSQRGAQADGVATVDDALALLDVGDAAYTLVCIDASLDEAVGELWARLTVLDVRVVWMRWPGARVSPSVAHSGLLRTRPLDAEALDEVLSDVRAPTETRTVVAPELASRHPLRVLVAEDNAVSRRVVEALLRNLGYSPDLVEDGEAAVLAARQAAYDLILMDMEMPRLGGVDAARRILEHSEVSPRIVAVTANVDAADEVRCRAAGMSGFLRKPFRSDELAQLLVSCDRAGGSSTR
jgi:PAS domain S-box-containing protein